MVLCRASCHRRVEAILDGLLKACEGVEGGLPLFVGESGGVGFFHPRPNLVEGVAQGGARGLFYPRAGGV